MRHGTGPCPITRVPMTQFRLIGHRSQSLNRLADRDARKARVHRHPSDDHGRIISIAKLAGALDNALRTGTTSVGEEAITLRMLLLPVC